VQVVTFFIAVSASVRDL
jgi:hypothetical protein